MITQKIRDVSEQLALFYNPATGQHALKALHPISMHATVHRFSAKERLQHPTYLSVQVAEHEHIHLWPEYLQYTNHSCEPNVFFDTHQLEMIAIRPINTGDEITYFYPSTEWSMAQAFECHCQSPRCLGLIKGAAHLDADTIARYRFTTHIQAKLGER